MAWVPAPAATGTWSPSNISGQTLRITEDGRIRITEDGRIRMLQQETDPWIGEALLPTTWTPIA